MIPAKGKSRRERGKEGEDLAAEFLERNGYRIMEKNYHYRHGEIDLVACENGILVFVEVKLRSSVSFGAPEEAVTPKKQELLRRTAEGYVMERDLPNTECRFDVVSIVVRKGIPEFTLLKDCF